VFINLLQQAFNCGILTPQSTVIKLKFKFRNYDFAGFTLKQVSLKIIIRIDFECDLKCLLRNFAVIFGFNGMGAAILTCKTHDNEISEIRHTCLAKFHFSRHHACMAGNLKDNRFFVHEILFIIRPIEVELDSFLPFLCESNLLFSFLLAESHGHQFLHRSFEIINLDSLVRKRVVQIFYV
jgi:hypothetical protein